VKIVYIIVSLLLVFLIYDNFFSQHSRQTPSVTINSPTPTPTQPSNKIVEPVAEFKTRITKKFYGTYITPQNSPIKPEKFTGFHTAVDVEYEDIKGDVPVYSIDDGQVIYSGQVNGYGGFIAIQYPQYIGIYGHLQPKSLLPNKSVIKKGNVIGILGQAYSAETDGERKHLHFAILKSVKLDFRGYVQTESELSLWIDPLTLFP